MRQRGEHAVVFRFAALVRVAVALDQPAAAQHLDAERIVLAERLDGGAQPLIQVLRLDAVAERAAAEAAQAAQTQ